MIIVIIKVNNILASIICAF